MSKTELFARIMSAYNSLLGAEVVRTQKEFADMLGVSPATLGRALSARPEYLTESLVTRAELVSQTRLRTAAPAGTVPMISAKLSKESAADMEAALQSGNVDRLPPVPMFARTDFYYFANTSAMEPRISSGDILGLKEIPTDAPIVAGDPYVVSTDYLGLVLRFAFDRGDILELRPLAPGFDVLMMRRNEIRHLYAVVGLVRTDI